MKKQININKQNRETSNSLSLGSIERISRINDQRYDDIKLQQEQR